MLPDSAMEAEPRRSAAPYPGLRPFEREERDLFFGRDRDAGFICDKIFSSTLTVLYGPSGVGKSSVLRTLVIPRLEEQQARALYFDAWSSEDPADALKEALVAIAGKLGVPAPGAGAPTLSDLVRLVTEMEGRTLVLILDQFEEFLKDHAQALDPLRRELGALVRPGGPDVRVLISLRQEFLAAMEPFHHDILNLFHSTDVVEPLDAKGVRAAIEQPALVFGRKWEPALVDRVMQDLAAVPTGDGDGARSVELPMLQLICRQLWRAAQASGDDQISLKLYQKLQGASRILDSYVGEVMPQEPAKRLLTAKLMIPLAPPSGIKMSYSVADLAAITGLAANRISVELERLTHHNILRSRDFRTGKRFELEHDAFIRIVGPWRDRVLRRATAVRWLRNVNAAVLALLLVGVVVVRAHADRERLRVSSTTRTPRSPSLNSECCRATSANGGPKARSDTWPSISCFDSKAPNGSRSWQRFSSNTRIFCRKTMASTGLA